MANSSLLCGVVILATAMCGLAKRRNQLEVSLALDVGSGASTKMFTSPTGPCTARDDSIKSLFGIKAQSKCAEIHYKETCDEALDDYGNSGRIPLLRQAHVRLETIR